MWKLRLGAFFVIVGASLLAWFIAVTEPSIVQSTKFPKYLSAPVASSTWPSKFPFRLGLDLSGGTLLTYRADLSKVKDADVADAMSSLRDVIERRVNLFGVSEPIVRTETSALSGNEKRLIVELPGVTDVKQAAALIGQTPTLEFKEERPDGQEKDAIIKARKDYVAAIQAGSTEKPSALAMQDPEFIDGPLTGQYLKRANVVFDNTTGKALVSIQFDSKGSDLFAEMTKRNKGKRIGIYLDGALLSAPTVQSEILGGQAQITGNFTAPEAKQLAERLNSGALPVPVELIGTQSIGPTLGSQALASGIHAGVFGFVVVVLFLVVWYRLPGIIAGLALIFYTIMMLTLFKLIPVTLSTAGIAGFIISIGMAVDANILIFERTKEELRDGKHVRDAVREGFARAWTSIRDSNFSSLISATILFWFGTSVVQGFALTFGVGVLVSMLSAITVSRVLLLSLGDFRTGRVAKFLFSSGIFK